MNNNELYHHGILGQKWGKKNGPPYPLNPSDRSYSEKKLSKHAKKDAKEFARAKMYYGEGAGTRRKLIRAKVEERSKNPIYKKHFDKYLSEQNMEEHASRAKAERKINTAKSKTRKTARGVMNLSLRTGARVSLGAAAVYSVLHATGADKKAAVYAGTKMRDIGKTAAHYAGKVKVDNIIKRFK